MQMVSAESQREVLGQSAMMIEDALSTTERKHKKVAAASQALVELAGKMERWTPISSITMDDIVRIENLFLSSDETLQIQLLPGTYGKVEEVDEDGDVRIRLAGIRNVTCTTRWYTRTSLARCR